MVIFFLMLLFEGQRLSPVLERTGAGYPVLLTVNRCLHEIGIKTKIYDLSARLHDEFDYIAKHSFFRDMQNVTPTLKARWQTMLSNQTLPAPAPSAKQTEKLPAKNTDSEIPLTDSTANAENPAQSVMRTSEDTQSDLTADLPIDQQADTQNSASFQEPISPVPQKETIQNTDQEKYRYNIYNYPFNAELVRNPETKSGIAGYAAHIPDYGKKKNVLLVGDSMMMEGLGPTLHARLRKRDNLTVHREGKYSSGLSRPDFFNWFDSLPPMLEAYQPDLLVISLGANDTQDIVIDRKRYFIDTKPWEEIYLQRSKDFITLADNGKRRILWVSLPVMGKEPYFTRTKRISKLQEEASKDVPLAQFVNIEHLLTENGKYTTFYKGKNNQSIRLRSQDLIHVSTEGGEILTDYVLPYVDAELAELYAEETPFCYPPVAGMANRVTFTSGLRQKQAEYYIWLPETQTMLTEPPNNQTADNEKKKGRNKYPDVPKLIAEQQGGKRYPVLYLLHGATNSGKEYVEMLGKELQELANSKQAIIVAPSCEPYGWYVDSPIVSENQIAGFITKELVPHIDSLYPTTKKRAIAGLSMGGHGALLLGFRNKNLFQSMASISGVLDIRMHKNNWKIKNLLGELTPENQKIWDDNSVLELINKKWPATSPRQIIVVTGNKDKLVLEENRSAQKSFQKRGFSMEYIEADGIHNWNFWQKHIPETLSKQADFLNTL